MTPMDNKRIWISFVRTSIPRGLVLLVYFFISFSSQVEGQQMKITSGAYLKNSGANIVVNAKVVNAGTIINNGTSTIKLSGNWQNDGTFTPSGCTVILRGTSSQDLGGDNETNFDNLLMNNTSGVTLQKGVTINGSLEFISGKITTGTNILTLGLSASVSGAGTGRYINGNQAWVFPGSGSPSKTFCVGDATNYTPILTDFTNITSSGTITANSTSGPHPNGTTSLISTVKRVNRYWTLTSEGLNFDHYDATFNFVPGDILGGADPADFIIQN